MTDGTLKKLVQLIGAAGDADLRRAAVLVAGAIGSAKEKELVQVLLDTLDDADPPLRLLALEALGQLGADEALPKLVDIVRHGSLELETAARAAGRLGVRGARAMEKVMADATPPVRRRIAAALALGGTRSAVLATGHALTDPDPTVVEAAARSLAAKIPALTDAQKRALADELIEAIGSKTPPLPAPSEAAMLRILSALHDSRAEDVYWSRVDPAHPTPLRAAALQALGTLPPPTSDTRLQRLLACAAERDFQVVAPALIILRHVPVTRKNVKHWQRLLEAPDVAARLFAVERLSEHDSPEVAQAFLPQLRHPDRQLRDRTLTALRGSATGRQALFEELLAAPVPDETWFLARALGESARDLPDTDRDRLFAQACRYQDEEDRRAEALWFLLREADAEQARTLIEERALALRKKRDYAKALAYLRLLTRDPAAGAPVRFEQAAVGLKLSGRDPSAVARNADPCLAQFARLLQEPAVDLPGAVAKGKWLDDEDLFYLGFHFAGEHRQAKEFGKAVLELLIKRSPRAKLATLAKQKLRSAGLA
ncbi:MAG: HEAT repeat domain-containing protein [Gemmataceae bacterium]|nr:HEAT repeat domain-containing protein [Gemmataceae bacterium]